jgi:hypothetical protein
MYVNTSKGTLEQKAKHYVTTNVTLRKMVSTRGIFTVSSTLKSTKTEKSMKKNRKRK